MREIGRRPDATAVDYVVQRGMAESRRLPVAVDTPPTMRWSLGGLLLEALAERNFDHLSECFDPGATMRALLPSGPADIEGAAQIAESFRRWFGNAEAFEVLDGTVGEIGDRLHLAWRLRLRPTPWGDDNWHIIEQQAYLRAGERIDAIDLLCSGFMPDPRS
jgi:hypothetical protein